MPMIKSGQAVPLFSWGTLDKNGNLARDPNFPELPHFEEAYEIAFGKKPSGIEWDAMRAMIKGTNEKDKADRAAYEAIVKAGGYDAQQAAMDEPEAYDDEAREMLTWFGGEVARRQLKVVGAK